MVLIEVRGVFEARRAYSWDQKGVDSGSWGRLERYV